MAKSKQTPKPVKADKTADSTAGKTAEKKTEKKAKTSADNPAKLGKSRKDTVSGKSGPTKAGPSAVDWPLFEPKLPLAYGPPLTATRHPDLPETIVLLQNFWPRSLCQRYVRFLSSLPLTRTIPQRGDADRHNDRFQIEDPLFAHRLWTETGLRECLLDEELAPLWNGNVVGLNGNIRIYRYSPGQYFGAHYDEDNLVSVPQDPNDPANVVEGRTTWTLLLYLTGPSDGCLGGETVFFPDEGIRRKKEPEREVAIAPETGMLLLHKHGDDCLLHEGRRVLEGEKWILRTDLCVQR